MYNKGFPIVNLDVLDNSGATGAVLFSATEDGLCVPFQFITAERGMPGEIVFGGGKELSAAFGSSTFLETSPYYTPAIGFIGRLMAQQGVCAMRLCPSDSAAATFGLFLEVIDAPIVQYQKNSDGTRKTDTNGNWLPILMPDGTTPTTANGITVKWVWRALNSNENYKALTKSTVQISGGTKEIYPILAGKVLSPGLYGNRQGLKLYSTGTEMETVAESVNSIIYRLVPMELPTSVSTTASPIQDRLGQNYSDISFKDVAIYTPSATNYGLKYTLGDRYTDTDTGETLLPYDIVTYSANVGVIGQKVINYSTGLDFTDPYLVDLIKGTDSTGMYLDHIAVDSASATVTNANVVNYAGGGADGDVSFTSLQSMIRDWIEGSDHGEFGNKTKWGITHFDDPGFSQDTKLAVINLVDLRDNIKVSLSTQDVMLPLNTKAQDLSIGLSLQFQALLHPESTINGVGCHRVAIYAHAGRLVNETPYTGIMPFTLDRALKRGLWAGGQYVKGSIGGRPNSDVTIFRNANWTADDDNDRKLFWAGGINTVMHASMSVIHYPDVRTVYDNDTSLLSNDEVSDDVLYIKKLIRRVWSKYSGLREVPTELFKRIQEEINNDCNAAMAGDSLTIQATIYQSALDADLGYALSARVVVKGPMPFRVGNFTIELQRYSA